MAWPDMGQAAASTQVASLPRKQTGTTQLNAKIGPPRRLVGGGGMAVGPLRNKAGVGIHPQAARTALVSGVKG